MKKITLMGILFLISFVLESHAQCSQEQISNNFENGLIITNGTQSVANDFRVNGSTATFSVNSIDANFFIATGDSVASVEVKFYNDNSGVSGSQNGSTYNIIPTSQTVIGSTVSGLDVREAVIDFSTPVDFPGSGGTDADAVYWVQLSATSTSSNNDVYWEVTSASIIGDGAAYYNGTTWSQTTTAFDGVFTINGTCVYSGNCIEPQNLKVSNIGETAADLSWGNVPGALNGYEWYIYAIGSDPSSATPVDSGSTSVGITSATSNGLFSETSYDIYVKSDCGGSDLSLFAGPVSFTTQVSNDNIAGAIGLTVNAACTGNPYTNINASVKTGEPIGSCDDGMIEHTLWFSFVAPASGNVVVSTDIPGGTLIDTQVTVYEIVNLNTLTEIGCGDDTTSNFLSTINLSGLVSGDTYFIQVDGNGGATGTFCIEVNEVYDYVYENGAWSPSNPSGSATTNDNILIVDGTATFTTDTHINDLTIDANAVLNIEQDLILEGNIVNNGSLVFINDATKLGQLGEFPGTITGSGETTVQRYIPGRRAYRFVSSAVTTSTSIHDNWQEGANNTGTNYPADNLDPNPGFGTHITGSTTGANGFDATISGNPSLMTFDNTNPTQPWNFVPNTDVLTLSAGKAYNLFVRGDRSIDLTNNTAPGTNTTLRATGSLHVGDYTDSNLSQAAGGFNFIGNPYQAIVDMNKVLENSTNINDEYYWIWDPNMADRGSYVLVTLPMGSVPNTSDANQFLQPGQAAFVVTLNADPASILFEESDKNVAAEPTEVFKTFPTDYIDLVMYESSAFLNDGPAADGFLVKFSPGENNAVDFRDALKWFNPDENITLTNNGNYLIMENRDLPTNGEVLQLYNNNYRHTNYIFKIEVNGLENYTVYLNDNYLGTQTQLASGTNQIDFSVDQNISASTANDRFYLSFQNLSIKKQMLAGFVVYPNPVNSGAFTISSPGFSRKANIALYDLLGRKVHREKVDFSIHNKLEVNIEQLQTGIYTLKLETELGKSFVQKLIVE